MKIIPVKNSLIMLGRSIRAMTEQEDVTRSRCFAPTPDGIRHGGSLRPTLGGRSIRAMTDREGMPRSRMLRPYAGWDPP